MDLCFCNKSIAYYTVDVYFFELFFTLYYISILAKEKQKENKEKSVII